MGKTFLFLLFCLLSSGLFLTGFSKQENTEKAKLTETPAPEGALQIVVPPSVQGHWKSVEIAILDHKINAETTYTINIGETFQVPDSPLYLRVDTFLPSFIVNDRQMTSESNETRNPAAYVTVIDGEEKIFSGWLFSLYPDAHAFHKARYNFNLTGYIPTN
jgi:hypothetical protein